MSARNPQPNGVISAIAGMLGFSVLAGVLVTAMVTPALAVTSMTASSTIGIFDNLPQWIEIGKQPQENTIYAIRGDQPEEIATVYNQNRQEVKWDEVAQVVKDAVVAGEDRRFYEHGGVDVQGLLRAALTNTLAGGVESGASTLSMQLVKNINIQVALQLPTEAERKAGVKAAQVSTIDRKLKEMKLAIGLEKKYDKDEILLAYLNIAGFGGNTYGIEAAAQRYYATTAANLTLPQAASLIAIVQQPTARALDNVDKYPKNQARRDTILNNMYAEKMITKAELDEALAIPVDETTVTLATPKNGCIAANPYAKQFCDYIVKSVKDLSSLGDTEAQRLENWKIGGYHIYTSLDLDLQTVSQDTVVKYANPAETRMNLGATSTIVQVGTGRIITMAQNKAFDDSELGGGVGTTALNFNTDRNYGGSSGFQVGSTYKVFTLLNWLNEGHGTNEMVNASPRTENQSSFTDTCTNPSGGMFYGGPYGGIYKFRNFGNEQGSRSVMNATRDSINGAYVSMALKLDLCKTKEIAMSLGVHPGIERDNPDTINYVENELMSNPSSILGTNDIAPLSVAAAYAGIANNGVYCKPRAVDRIVDSQGTELPGQAQECSPSLISAEVAAAAMHALTYAMGSYGANPKNGIPHFGKTGTTNGAEQTWVVSSTTAMTSVTWVGNITGDYGINKYPNGPNLRHIISKTIMLQVDAKFGGGALPVPPQRLLTGTGVTVDNVIGQTPEIAKSIIEARQLVYADGGEVDSDLPIGQIAYTDPSGGTVVASGTTVTAYTSNGSMSALPDVVTGNPNFGTAQGTLNTAGFSNVVQSCEVTTTPALVGKVIKSDPAAGTVYKRASEVKLGVGALVC